MFDNKKLTKSFLLIIMTVLSVSTLVSCAKKEPEVKTEIQEVPKSVDQMMETADSVKPKPVENSIDDLITKTLLNHYKDQFGDFGNQIKATGYKMYLIEDGAPGEKKAYGYASYNEYQIDGDRVVLKCGSGATPVALTLKTDGSMGTVDYEVLTDSDYKSEEFKKAFPESVRDKIANRNMDDMAEIKKNEHDMVKREYKRITGKDLKTEISDVVE